MAAQRGGGRRRRGRRDDGRRRRAREGSGGGGAGPTRAVQCGAEDLRRHAGGQTAVVATATSGGGSVSRVGGRGDGDERQVPPVI